MKKITVFVTHSFGELDLLIPLFYELKSQRKFKIKIIITAKHIFEKLQTNKFYQEQIQFLNIKVVYCSLFYKFDYSNNHYINRNINLIQKNFNINNKYLEPFKFIRFIIKNYLSIKLFIKNFTIGFSDIIMFETTNQLKNDLVYFIFNNIFKKKIFIYHHGHSFNFAPIATLSKFKAENNQRKKFQSEKENSTFLLYHQENEDWARYLGFNRLHLIGFPKYFKEWFKFIKKESKFHIEKKYVVIFSRAYDHKYYMNSKNYEYLFRSSIEVLKEKLPSHKIYIKTHPRENDDFLKSLISKYKVKNIEITDINSQILSINAFLTISFWSSCIMDSIALQIPSVEFYIGTEKFKIDQPLGTIYRRSGVDAVDTKHSLREFIERCINGKYEILTKFVNKISKTQDLSIFFD